jgi:hypothetical protein
MPKFTSKFILVECPTSEESADALSISVTRDHGTQGFHVVSAVRIGDGALLLCLVRQEA